MLYRKNFLKTTNFIYCSIRIPHYPVNNTTLYHLTEHMLYNGIIIPELNMLHGFEHTNFIISPIAFTDKAAVNICFMTLKMFIPKVKLLFNYLIDKNFKIDMSILSEQKKRISEEIINRNSNDYLSWRDTILNTILNDDILGFNETGNLDELNKLNESDIIKYIDSDKIKFNFYYKKGKNEYFYTQNNIYKSSINKVKNYLLFSTERNRISIVSNIPINSKNDYLFALILNDLIFNANYSLLKNYISNTFNIHTIFFESELYDNVIISHFTIIVPDNNDLYNIVNGIKRFLCEKKSINLNIIKNEIIKTMFSYEISSSPKSFQAYFSLLRLMNNFYNLKDNDFFKSNKQLLLNQINEFFPITLYEINLDRK